MLEKLNKQLKNKTKENQLPEFLWQNFKFSEIISAAIDMKQDFTGRLF